MSGEVVVKKYWFQWVQGGWNTVSANNVREAYDKAADLGALTNPPLIPNRGSFTSKPEYGKRLEEKWSVA